MFEEARQLGDTERKIALETRAGTPIDNFVEVDPVPPHCSKRYLDFVTLYGQNWVERKPATGFYNCAGQVWASRRATMLDPMVWAVILVEDGYRPLPQGEIPWCGDIAVYIDRDKEDEILHVARVYALDEGMTATSPRIPLVISKWNSTSGESLHRAFDVPYAREYNFELRFYTDRPNPQALS
jgi:hypothetical protein